MTKREQKQKKENMSKHAMLKQLQTILANQDVQFGNHSTLISAYIYKYTLLWGRNSSISRDGLPKVKYIVYMTSYTIINFSIHNIHT